MAKYYLIHQCENRHEIGSIIRTNENDTIERVVKGKRFGSGDKVKWIELSSTEYKYYAFVEQYKRLNRWEDGMFAKISALEPGDLCKAEILGKYVKVKIIDNNIENGDINLKCEYGDGHTSDISAHLIYDIIFASTENEERKPSISKTNVAEDVQEAPIADGYYILTKKYSENEPGTLYIVRNGNVILTSHTSFFTNCSTFINLLVELEKGEAKFLQKFSIDKRMKQYEEQRFQIMKDLPIGQECHLRKNTIFPTTYIIRAKNIEDDGIKYDLGSKKSPNVIVHRGVDAFDITLSTDFWKIMNNSASRFKRRMSRISVSRSSNNSQATDEFDIEDEKLHFIDDKIVDTTKIYYIKPFKEIREEGISIGDPVMMQMRMESQIGEVKWLGVINNEKCVGLDMEERFNYGMNGIITDKVIFKCLEGHGLVTPLTNVKLWEDAKRPHFMENELINPNKYLKCEEQWNKSFLEERNVKKNDFVLIVINDDDKQVKMKGTLRWCGLMNDMPMVAVELNGDCYYGTDGKFWRHQLFKCPDKRAIAVLWTNIYPYLPYKQKIIPNEDRVFPEIDIDSVVKYYLAIGVEVKDLYGTIKWSGIDEYGRYLYGLELEDKLANGTDGTFNGQRLFQCRLGHGILAPLDSISKDLRFIDLEYELMNKYFLDLLRCSNNRNLEVQILKDVMEMKNKRILKSFLEDKGHPVNLEVHQDLLPFLIREEYIELIQLLLNNCDASTLKSQTCLLLANMAIKKNDENLLMCALEKCKDKNELLANGETFFSNLFKENISEEVINSLITKKFFNANLTNKEGESPLTLACQRLMASTVKNLILHYPLSTNQKQAAMNLTLEAKGNLSTLNRSMEDVLKICEIFNNTTTTTLVECSICMDREVNVVFECGHVSCDTCATQLFNCPMCNKEIENVRKCYI